MDMQVLSFKGETYFVTKESYEKLYLYMFDMYHMPQPNPEAESRFISLLEKCDFFPGI